jgi:hypothetical protein
VKTRKSREGAELFSLFSSFDGGWQSCSFLIQRNRDKLSTRKFDVGVFTQPGPGTDIPNRTSDPALNHRFLRAQERSEQRREGTAMHHAAAPIIDRLECQRVNFLSG